MTAREIRLETVREAALLERGGHRVLFVVLRGAGADTRAIDYPDVEAIVAVARLPRTASGEIDAEILSGLPVLSEEVRAKTEESLRILPGVRDAAVFIQELPRERKHHHPRELYTLQAGPPSPPPQLSSGTGVSAYADGGPAVGGPATLAEVLRTAATRAQALIFIDEAGREETIVTQVLLREAEHVGGGLLAQGARPGQPVLISLPDARSILTSFWGAVLAGIIPAIAEKPAAASELLEKPLIISDENYLELKQSAPLTAHHAADPSDTAIYNLTSGSTGTPKCIALSHAGLLARARGTNVQMGFSPKDVTFSFLPFDHIGAISDWHLRPLELGAKQVFAPKNLVLGKPLVWLDILDKYAVTASWAPNFFFQLVLSELERARIPRQWDLSPAECLLTAGESVSRKTVETFTRELARFGLKKEAVVPAFGMAELGSGVSYAKPLPGESARFFDHDGASFADLGPPIPGAKIRIVGPDGAIVSENTPGEVQIGGAVVAKGYYRASAEQSALFRPDGWLETGDRGFLTSGRLVLTGRSKDVIIIAGANYYAHELETLVESVDGVRSSFTAALGARMPEEKLAILFVSMLPREQHAEQVRAIRRAVVARAGINPEIVLPVEEQTIPKSAIGKIMRTRLVRQLEAGEFDDAIARIEALTGGPGAVPAWFYERVYRPAIGTRLGGAEPPAATSQSSPALRVEKPLPRGGEFVLIAREPAAVKLAEEIYAKLRERRQTARIVEDGRLVLSDLDTAILCDGYAIELRDRKSDRAISAILSFISATKNDARLVVLARGATSRCPVGAALFAYARAAGAERPLRLIDLEGGLGDAQLAAQEIIEGDAAEVAFHNRVRNIPQLSPLHWPDPPRPAALVRGGYYAITGGNGGLGRALAAYLREKLDAKIFVLARPAVDLTQTRSIETALREQEKIFGAPLAGVFHLAGSFRERSFGGETRETLEESFAGKMRGAEALAEAMSSWPGAAFIGFSSLAGTLGGSRLGAYAAANAYLDALAVQLRAEGRLAVSLAFSAFSEIGLGRDAAESELLRSRGYMPISPQRGFASVIAALSREEANILVGLDPIHPEARAHDLEAPVELGTLTADVASDRLLGPLKSSADVFGRRADVAIRRVEHVSRTTAREGHTAPETKVEKELASMWRALLGAAEVSKEDDFFSLGGHSLLATQLVSRIRDQFSVELPLGKLFEATTLQAMAQLVEELRVSTDDLSLMLDQVQHLSPEELARLLEEDAKDTAARAELSPQPGSPRLKFDTFGIITANRPEALARSAESYLENLRAHGRKINFVVTDDSRDEKIAQENRARLAKLSDELEMPIFHGWIDQKLKFIDALVKRTGAPLSIARAGLVRGASGVYACGVNRNSYQMANAGDVMFAADDDTMARVSRAPHAQDGAGIAAGIDGAEMWFFNDREDALRSVPAQPADLASLHEAVIGRTAADLSPSTAFSEPIDPEVQKRLISPSSRVRVTIAGLLGDCGWAVPFGQWGGPMGYLVLDDGSRARLVETEDTYRRGCVSRQILRVTDRVRVTDATYSMSTFCGFDNRSVLAPHVVSLRGADLIFGATLWRTHPDAVFAHMPHALFHAPLEKREFHVGELMRTALGFDVTRLFINLMNSVPDPKTRDPGERLEIIGRWLIEIADLPSADFWAMIAEQGRRAEMALIARIEAQLGRHSRAPRWWADDLTRYVELLSRSIKKDRWFLPLDVRGTVDTDEEADVLTRKMVREQGELMIWWPAFFNAAVELRAQGIRMVEPVSKRGEL
jgi:acyl-CoA synthetase (AMP-forming)/AMP-acid ligase II/acyl carrier protein